MQIKRTALAAIVIAAVAAPNASGMVADGVVINPAAQSTAEPDHHANRFADELALKKAERNRERLQAENAPVVPLVVRTDADGFDWSSALIGATVPLALLLAALLVRPALKRRRAHTSVVA